MKHLTRVAAITAATALAAAGLVGSAATSATAAKKAPLVTTYSCDAIGNQFDLPVTLSTKLPTKVKAGKKVTPKGLTFEVAVPASLADAAVGFFQATELGGTLAGDATAGKTKIALSGTSDLVEIAAPPVDMTLPGTGKTGAFKIAKPGTYTIKAPTSLTFIPLKDGGAELSPGFSIPCVLADGAPSKLGSIKVTK